MLEKFEILIVIFALLITFYLIISWGAGRRRKSFQQPEIKSYLRGVNILILILAIVGFLLWMFI